MIDHSSARTLLARAQAEAAGLKSLEESEQDLATTLVEEGLLRLDDATEPAGSLVITPEGRRFLSEEAAAL